MSIKLEELSLKEKLGQMFMIGTEKKYIDDELKSMLLDYKIGGIILYKRNYDSYKEMIQFINNLKRINRENKIPLFIAIDQEGGRCNRMPKEFDNLLSATSFAKTQDLELVKKSGRIIGKILFNSGINMNFAPVLDIKRFPDSHPIGNRCYGETKEDVIKYGISVMKELQNENIIPVIKHLPGHGATTMDSHIFLPIIKKNMQILEKEDLLPFIKAMKDGAEAMMVGHLLIKDMNKIYPASLSKEFITNYIRRKYHYEGIIITDDLKMGAIQFIYGPTVATKLAFNAGSDIIINRFHYKSVIRTVDTILKKSNKDTELVNRINESSNRIIKLKEKYKLKDEQVECLDINKINYKINTINLEARNYTKT